MSQGVLGIFIAVPYLRAGGRDEDPLQDCHMADKKVCGKV